MNTDNTITKEYLEENFATKKYFEETLDKKLKSFVTKDYLDKKLDNYVTKDYLDYKLDKSFKEFREDFGKDIKQHMTDLKTFFREDNRVMYDHIKTLEEDIKKVDKRVDGLELQMA